MDSARERLELFGAAVFLRLHPYLLLRCVKYVARKNGGLKLRSHSENGQTYFLKSELLEFDDDLRKSWVSKKSDPRPPIPHYFEDLLRHESAFMCALCSSPLSTDFAHIQPWETVLHHHPHNLICLCGECHRGYDREKRIDRASIEEAKQRMIRQLLHFLQRSTIPGHGAQLDLPHLCRELLEYLTENSVAFRSFGPQSDLAKDLQSMDVADVWHRLRLDTVLPNNKEISRLLLSHRSLYEDDSDFVHLADKFLAHAASYRRFVDEPNEVHSNFLFPNDFAARVKEVAIGK